MLRTPNEEGGPCAERLVGLLGEVLAAGWTLQQSFDVGNPSDESAVASVALVRSDGGSLSVTLQRRIEAFRDHGVAPHDDYVQGIAPSGAEMASRDVPGGPRQVILRRATGLMINVTTSGLLGRGVPVPLSLAGVQMLAANLDRDEAESVFAIQHPPGNAASQATP